MPLVFTKNVFVSIREDATAPGISEQTSARADSSNELLEKPLSATPVKATKSNFPMVV